MNAYETAQSLGLVGTPQQIVDQLKATGLTVQPIDRATLVHVLNMRKMLTKIVGNDSSEKWTGTVLNMQDIILQLGSDTEKTGIRLWLSHITNPTNLKWDTTQIEFAAPFWAMYQAFAGKTFSNKEMPSAADFQALAALGGGWRFATLTVEQYEAQRTAATISDDLQSVLDTCDETAREAARQTGASLASIKAAVIAALGG